MLRVDPCEGGASELKSATETRSPYTSQSQYIRFCFFSCTLEPPPPLQVQFLSFFLGFRVLVLRALGLRVRVSGLKD
jgi:hypothetical protein